MKREVVRASTYARPGRSAASWSVKSSPGSTRTTGGGNRGDIPPSIEGGITPRSSRTSSSEVVSQCLKLLRSLDRGDQKQALDHLAFQLNSDSGTASSRDKDLWSGAVYDALVRLIGGGAGGLPGPMLFKRVLATPESWQYVEGFLGSSGFSSVAVTERNAVYQLLSKILAGHALELNRKFGYPLTPKMLGNLTQHLPTLFEEAFPGYLAAGMGPVIIRSLVKGFQAPDQDDYD